MSRRRSGTAKITDWPDRLILRAEISFMCCALLTAAGSFLDVKDVVDGIATIVSNAHSAGYAKNVNPISNIIRKIT